MIYIITLLLFAEVAVVYSVCKEMSGAAIFSRQRGMESR